MIPINPTSIPGAVLSNEDIYQVIADKHIIIKTPTDENSKDFDNPKEFDDAIQGKRDVLGCLESAGYLIQPEAYWDGKDFKLIGRNGYVLKPNQHAVIRTFQWIKFSADYCAIHFGLHRNQMVGIFIGSGQIQPEWGPAPLYVTIWNSGKANFVIRRGEPISRLIFLKMTSGNVTGRFTQVRVVRDSIKEDLTEQTLKERNRKLRILGLYTLGVVVVIAGFFVGPLVLPFLASEPRINGTYGGLLAGVLGFLFVGIINTVKGLRK